MPKFFIHPEQVQDNVIIIEGNDVNHIHRVMRLGMGDRITICDGQGTDYMCIIEEIEAEKIMATVVSIQSTDSEPHVQVYLYQSLPKSDKMEYIIQKSVELGVHQIIPVSTDRTIVRFSDDKKAQKKIERWNKISESAAKQSGRGNIPSISHILTYEQAVVESQKHDLTIIPYEKEKNITLHDLFKEKTYGTIGIFIGPEGGFTEDEIRLAMEHQIVPLTLGSRILRTETVSSAVLSIIMYESGEI